MNKVLYERDRETLRVMFKTKNHSCCIKIIIINEIKLDWTKGKK